MKFPKRQKAKTGIYLGWEGLTIVKTAAKKIDDSVYVPYSSPEEKLDITSLLPESVKFVALIQKGLRQLKLESVGIDCAVAVTQRDILVRFISIPFLPASEINKALSFEIRKYIPFRLEELKHVYQRFHRGRESKVDMLWMGIKKDTYNQYTSALEQARINIKVLEPASMSVVRILAGKINIKKENIAIIDTSPIDSNITILNNGVPIFTREVKFSSPILSNDQEIELVKLSNEFRMAFDFYRRQYSLGEISRIILISDLNVSSIFSDMAKEMGLSLDSYQPKDLIGSNSENISVEMLRAAGVSLRDSIRTSFRINLHKKPQKKGILSYLTLGIEHALPISKIAVTTIAIFCACIILVMFILGYTRIGKIQRDIYTLRDNEPKVSKKYTDLLLPNLRKEKDSLQGKIDASQSLLREVTFSSEQLSTLAKIVPSGIWLDDFAYVRVDAKNTELRLNGYAYLGDQKEENKVIDVFIDTLNENADFSKSFQSIKLDSKLRSKIEKYQVQKFSISCLPQ